MPEASRRTLVLISKILTNIANQQIVGDGAKEVFMKKTDAFVSKNMENSISFLLSIANPLPQFECKKIKMDQEKTILVYKHISTELIKGGRDSLISNLELVKNPKTGKPFLINFNMPLPLFQLYFPLIKQMGIPEKGFFPT